jgi:exodeoxyribonuclease V alpha subunit
MATGPVFRKSTQEPLFGPDELPQAAPAPARAPAPVEKEPEFTVKGKVTRILFENEEDGFYIFVVQRTGTRSPQDQVKIKGYGHKLGVGVELESVGTYEAGKGQYKDELTLKANAITEVIPTSVEGIRKMLHNGFVKGIGPKYADLLLAHFGANLLDVAETHPQRILQVPGIGDVRGQAFVNAVAEKKAVPRIMSFLAEIGLGPGLSHRVFKELGVNAVRTVKQNPYALTSVPMIGFTVADRVARQIGIPPDSVTRIEAGIQALLLKESENGSTVVSREKTLAEVSKMLAYPSDKKGDVGTVTIPAARLASVLDKALVDQRLVQSRTFSDGTVGLSLPQFVMQESRIALALARVAHATTKSMRHVDMASAHFAHLDDDQKVAAQTALTSNVSVITGRPGCGKTTVTKSIIQALQESGRSYMACGPTGRAAKRFMEATGFEASTMHRALESKGTGAFGRDENNPFNVDFILADEQSMSDTYISHCMLKAVASGTQMCYIGDVNQLGSIDAGKVLRDIIESGRVPVSVLSKIHRQAAGSDIITNAHRIIEGEVPVSSGKGSDFSMVNCTDTAAQVAVIVEEYNALLNKGFKPEDIQILTPMRKKTDLGANALNRELKAILNPGNPGQSIKRGKFENEIMFSPGDRVMQVANNKELGIFNGDIGYIKSIDKKMDEILVDFSGEEVLMSSDDLDDVDLAYATTIHKSQGSEFPAVIIPVSNSHWMMWDRNLLYTGVTRGKQEVVLAGDMYMLKRIVSTQNASQRVTGLRDEIEQAFDMYDAKAKPKVRTPSKSF